MTIYRPARNVSVEGDLPQKFWPGGGNSGVYLRRKFWPGGRISSPPEIFISENSGQKFRPFTAGCTTAWRKGLSEILRAGNSRISGPPLQAAPHPVVKDLAKFSRAGNYEISGPQKFCQTRISGPFTTRCTTKFSKGLSQISKG
jgi:hypothetical protein